MKFNRMFLASGAALILACGMISCGAKQEGSADAQADATEVAAEEAAVPESAVIVLQKDEALPASGDKLVVIDFNATWCGPCRQFGPHFEAVAAQNAGKALFYSVDVDVHPSIAEKYGVESIPMVVYIQPDGSYDSTVGYMDEEQFAKVVADHLK